MRTNQAWRLTHRWLNVRALVSRFISAGTVFLLPVVLLTVGGGVGVANASTGVQVALTPAAQTVALGADFYLDFESTQAK